MQYDPIKRSLGKVFNTTPRLRILFYKLLDLLLLRAWHIHHELKSFRKHANEEALVIDAGSGFGQYSYYLSSLGKNWKILGLDVKEEQIEDCNAFFKKIRRNDRVHFEVADLTRLEKGDEADLILCVDVMEHIEEDTLVFRNFHETLKKGGMLLISTPSDKGGSDVHDEHDESFIDEHVREGYSIEDITAKLGKAGFEKSQARYSYGKPGKLSWKLSMKFPIMTLNKSKLFFILLPFYYVLIFPVSLVLNIMDVRKKHKEGTGLIVKAWK
ncbi:MAG: class I SAM-dependent methyltransferase [Bacteroidales bacterium]